MGKFFEPEKNAAQMMMSRAVLKESVRAISCHKRVDLGFQAICHPRNELAELSAEFGTPDNTIVADGSVQYPVSGIFHGETWPAEQLP